MAREAFVEEEGRGGEGIVGTPGPVDPESLGSQHGHRQETQACSPL